MEESSIRPRREDRLSHREVQNVILGLGEAGMLDLDKSIRTVMEPVSRVLPEDPASTVSLHIVCCNEYGLVTP